MKVRYVVTREERVFPAVDVVSTDTCQIHTYDREGERTRGDGSETVNGRQMSTSSSSDTFCVFVQFSASSAGSSSRGCGGSSLRLKRGGLPAQQSHCYE